ncbi:hypothetical protein GCM10022254_43950 [Actinomadura meridiana]|uniref:Neocarzinostatin family protein n=1 Tax=Actinomadura meridiana TaxID=559626 RepID=A0ABP8C9J7_9ACTN
MAASTIRRTLGIAAIAAGALLATTPAAMADAAPQLTVTPSTNLTDGQQVAVNATGFTPGDSVTAVQCSTGEWPNVKCDLADAPTPVTADANGAAALTLTVRSSFEGADPTTGDPAGTVDCTVAPGCDVRGGSQTDPSGVFAPPVPITFG